MLRCLVLAHKCTMYSLHWKCKVQWNKYFDRHIFDICNTHDSEIFSERLLNDYEEKSCFKFSKTIFFESCTATQISGAKYSEINISTDIYLIFATHMILKFFLSVYLRIMKRKAVSNSQKQFFSSHALLHKSQVQSTVK